MTAECNILSVNITCTIYGFIYKKPAEVQVVHTFSGKSTLPDILTTSLSKNKKMAA